MLYDQIREVVLDQHEVRLPPNYVDRSVFEKIKRFQETKEVVVITGLRRTGKSTILQRLRQLETPSDYFLNFEDDRLVSFDVSDFQRLLEIFLELYGPQKTFFFDEIERVPEWERFVRRLRDQNYKVYLTGSNAELLSAELGTLLTGRYLQVQVHPYSFQEFVGHHLPKLPSMKRWTTAQKGALRNLFAKYKQCGGIPEFTTTAITDYLHLLYEGVLYRDIIARRKLPNDKPMRELVRYLASNVGKEQSYNGIAKLLGMGSASTVSEYFHYLQMSYLCFFINRYSPSVKTQMHSTKKVYFSDHALAKQLGFRFSEDRGRLLENLIYIELLRQGFEIYYHKGQKECDFIVRQEGHIVAAFQACASLADEKTRQRELEGLQEALETYSLEKGYIITEEEEETITLPSGLTAIVIPVWKWLL